MEDIAQYLLDFDDVSPKKGSGGSGGGSSSSGSGGSGGRPSRPSGNWNWSWLTDMEQETIIIVSVFSATIALLLLLVVVLFTKVSSLRKRVEEIQEMGFVRVQKAQMENDKNHAFHNPAISPDEELAKRGYSMYSGDDVESGRDTGRQTGGQFVDELAREIDYRQQRQQSQQQQQAPHQQNSPPHPQNSSLHRHHPQVHQNQQQAPPFLLQSIEENKRKSRSLANPVANAGRASDTNPNFIY